MSARPLARPAPPAVHGAVPAAAGSRATRSGRRAAGGLTAVPAPANAAGRAFDPHARSRWFDRVPHAATVPTPTYRAAASVPRRVPTGLGRHRALPGAVVARVGVAAGAWREVAGWCFGRVAPNGGVEGEHDTVLAPVPDARGAALAAWMSPRVPRPAGAPEGGRA